LLKTLFGWTLEYQNWGWNLLTVAAIATFVIILLQATALILQSRRIWKKENGDSVSVTWISLFGFTFLTFAIYGIYQQGLVMLVNGLLGLLHLPILIGLWKYKRIALSEHVVTVVCVFMIPAIVLLPQKAALLFVFMGVSNCSLLAQAIEIYRKEKVGAVDIRLIMTYLVGAGFWIVYSTAISDYVLMTLMIMAFMCLSLVAGAWLTYRNRQADPIS
jgi:uncharacterized protein with PQ loop repeat